MHKHTTHVHRQICTHAYLFYVRKYRKETADIPLDIVTKREEIS